MPTVAQALADLLSVWGVQFVFGTAGDTILPFLACLGEHPLRLVQMRNEESAAYAASAVAKLTGTVGVVVSDGGPGTGRLVNGLADALSDRASVLAISGQVESMYLGTGHKQYINQQQLLGAITLRSENLGCPSSFQTVASDLLRTAVSQAGPVHLSIPKDFWQQQTQEVTAKPEPYLKETAQSSVGVIEQGAEWLKNLQKPMILAGRGAMQALPEVLVLAEKLGAGVVYTLPLVGAVPGHPLVVGGLGPGGSEAATELLGECDGVVKVGATYWPTVLTSDKKKVLAIDSHPANISRGIPADFGLVGEAQTVLAELVSRLDTSAPRESWSARVQQLAAKWRQRLQSE